MKVWDIFSKRLKILRGEVQDVYSYDKFPDELKIQIIHILKDVFNIDNEVHHTTMDTWKEIQAIFCREYGVFFLTKRDADPVTDVFNFFLQNEEVPKCLDVVEVTFSFVDRYVRSNQWNFNYSFGADEAISELNHRFKEHAVGYQYAGGKIIKADSEFLHNEVVRPVINLLFNPGYESINQEFLKAHEHYRNQLYGESINECLKAFESSMKLICHTKGWRYENHFTAKKLIQVILENNLIPSYLQTQASSLQGLLESGIPTVRNKESGHGQGPFPKTISESYSRYVLNLTGTTILFFLNLMEEKSA